MKHLLLACCAAASLSAALAAVPAEAQRQPPHPVVPAAASASASAGIVAVVNGDVITTGDVEQPRPPVRAQHRPAGHPRGAGPPPPPGPPGSWWTSASASRRPSSRKIAVGDQRDRRRHRRHRAAATACPSPAPCGAGLERPAASPSAPSSTRCACRSAGPACCARSSAPAADISDADVAEQVRLSSRSQAGQPEYHLQRDLPPHRGPGPAALRPSALPTPSSRQLRAGAPFPVVAAQFSQSQTALQGGDLGWVRRERSSTPRSPRSSTQMPPGAVSNPIAVPGGVDHRRRWGPKREVSAARPPRTCCHLRQVFIPISTAR